MADFSTMLSALRVWSLANNSAGASFVSSPISVRKRSHSTAIFFSEILRGWNFGSSTNTKRSPSMVRSGCSTLITA